MTAKNVTIELPEKVVGDLEELLAYGIFGTTVEQLCERMVCEQLMARIKEGWLGGHWSQKAEGT